MEKLRNSRRPASGPLPRTLTGHHISRNFSPNGPLKSPLTIWRKELENEQRLLICFGMQGLAWKLSLVRTYRVGARVERTEVMKSCSECSNALPLQKLEDVAGTRTFEVN
jgi:hypothetical protein